MTVYLIMLALICLIGVRINNSGDDRYLDKEHSASLKGIFVLIILLSHFNQYITIENTAFNYPYLLFFERIGQLMVTPFLFFSGYGIMLSIEKKSHYLDSFLKNRVLKTLIHFDLAVVIYYVMNLILGISYAENPLLVLLGWSSIGNSNWYIFVLLSLYLLTYLVFMLLPGKNRLLQLTGVTVLSGVLIFALMQLKEVYWYDTIPAYAAGMWYYHYKDKINYLLNKYYFIMLIFGGVSVMLLNVLGYRGILLANLINSFMFCLLLLTVTFKLEINNRFLNKLGNYVFEVYILQRIAYIVLGRFTMNVHVYFIASCIMIAVMSYLFKLVTRLLDSRLLKD